MTNKPIFSPSAISDYERCKFLYLTFWEHYQDLPSRIDPQPYLGTLGHVLQAAHETGDDPAAALTAEIKKYKKLTSYGVKEFPVLGQLEKESLKVFHGGSVTAPKGKVSHFSSYPAFREGLRANGERLLTVAVEKRLWSDLGSIIATPKLDLVLRTEDSDEMWIAEWKFTERDDSDWQNRWLMDGQTTLQILAAEKYYDREFKGLLLLPVLYGRKQALKGVLDKKSIIGRPIIRVTRPEARMVSKNSPELRANYIGRLEDLAFDYRERKRSNRWPTTGMDTRQCDRCRLRGICCGQGTARELVPKIYLDLKRIREKGKQT